MRGSSGNLVFKFKAWTPTRLGSGQIFTRWKSNLLRSVATNVIYMNLGYYVPSYTVSPYKRQQTKNYSVTTKELQTETNSATTNWNKKSLQTETNLLLIIGWWSLQTDTNSLQTT